MKTPILAILATLALAACDTLAPYVPLEQQNCLAKQAAAGALHGGVGSGNPLTVQLQADARDACAGLYGIDPVTP